MDVQLVHAKMFKANNQIVMFENPHYFSGSLGTQTINCVYYPRLKAILLGYHVSRLA